MKILSQSFILLFKMDSINEYLTKPENEDNSLSTNITEDPTKSKIMKKISTLCKALGIIIIIFGILYGIFVSSQALFGVAGA